MYSAFVRPEEDLNGGDNAMMMMILVACAHNNLSNHYIQNEWVDTHIYIIAKTRP